jgi:hypothetical protein
LVLEDQNLIVKERAMKMKRLPAFLKGYFWDVDVKNYFEREARTLAV